MTSTDERLSRVVERFNVRIDLLEAKILLLEHRLVEARSARGGCAGLPTDEDDSRVMDQLMAVLS